MEAEEEAVDSRFVICVEDISNVWANIKSVSLLCPLNDVSVIAERPSHVFARIRSYGHDCFKFIIQSGTWHGFNCLNFASART